MVSLELGPETVVQVLHLTFQARAPLMQVVVAVGYIPAVVPPGLAAQAVEEMVQILGLQPQEPQTQAVVGAELEMAVRAEQAVPV
jgi:hypothetical protein